MRKIYSINNREKRFICDVDPCIGFAQQIKGMYDDGEIHNTETMYGTKASGDKFRVQCKDGNVDNYLVKEVK